MLISSILVVLAKEQQIFLYYFRIISCYMLKEEKNSGFKGDKKIIKLIYKRSSSNRAFPEKIKQFYLANLKITMF